MSTQKAIAEALGLSQATVSMALRGSRKVSVEMQKKVAETAQRLGYRPNPYVSALMANIRMGKGVKDQGTIAVLVDKKSEREWARNSKVFPLYANGIARRADELGFRVERYFLRESGMTPERLDSILYTRGIRGVIFAPPYPGNRRFSIHWERYACIGIGMGWEKQDFDLVDQDHLSNYIIAFRALESLGYQRIGTVLPEWHVVSHRRGTRWVPGYCDCQHGLSRSRQIPLFAGDPVNVQKREFQKWFAKWKPDAILSIAGVEKGCVEEMGLRAPEDVAIACLAVPPNSPLSGVDERNEKAGAAAVELVAAKIFRNEFGLSEEPTVLMVEGRWVDGQTTRLPLA